MSIKDEIHLDERKTKLPRTEDKEYFSRLKYKTEKINGIQ